MTHTFITTGKLLASSLVIAMAFSSTAMAQAKSSTTTPQTDVDNAQPNAISYGSTRSNTKSIAAPTGETPDVSDVTERANINTSRSNKLTGSITAPSGETPDVGDVLPNAISYGSTRSNTKQIAAPAGNTGTAENGTTRANINTSRSGRLAGIAAPADVTPDIGDAIKPANTYGVTRSNRSATIAAPIGCVTEAGAKDANCDGVDDAAQSR